MQNRKTRLFSETLKIDLLTFSHLLMRDHSCVTRSRPELKQMGLNECIFSYSLKGEKYMNIALTGAEMVARWRNGEGQNNPAGPLFAAGEFAQADIVHATAKVTGCCLCTGSIQHTIHIECC